MELTGIFIDGNHIEPSAQTSDDVTARPGPDHQSIDTWSGTDTGQRVSGAGVFLTSVDGLHSATELESATPQVVAKQQIVATQGTRLIEDQISLFVVGRIANENHLNGKNKAVCALRVLKRVHRLVTAGLHRSLDSPGVSPMHNQSQGCLGGSVDDGELTEKHLKLLVGEKDVPIRSANFNKKAKLSTVVKFLNIVRLSYPSWKSDLKSALRDADAKNVDMVAISHMRDLTKLMEFFIPVVSIYIVCLSEWLH